METLFYLLLAIFALFCFWSFLLRELTFKFISLFNEDKAFNLRLKYAKHYKHDGLYYGGTNLPQARVLYPDGKVSRNMPIGNAKDYADIFNGTVIRPK